MSSNSWETETPTLNDKIFWQIRSFMNEGLDLSEARIRLLVWAKENSITLSKSELISKLCWAYRKWVA